MQSWFQRWAELRTVAGVYTEVLLTEGAYEESTFLRILQALEHFHGVVDPRGGHYLASGAWRLLQQWLEANLPEESTFSENSLPSRGSFREVFLKRASDLNRLSFRSRLQRLFDAIPVTTLMPMVNNPAKPDEFLESFLKQLEVTRNFLVHYDEKNAKKALRGRDLREASFTCWAVLTYWIAVELGFNSEAAGELAYGAKHGMFVVAQPNRL